MRILLVDDEPDILDILRRMLPAEAICDMASDGDEALEQVRKALAEEKPYDLITMDIRMERVDGHEAAKGIRKLEEEQGIQLGDGSKILMVTAVENAENVLESFHRDGADGYLTKPFLYSEVKKELRKLGISY